jgi:hypothetical protein
MALQCPNDCPPAIYLNKQTRDEEDENLHDHHESNSPPKKHGDRQYIRPVAGGGLGGSPPGFGMAFVAAIIGSLVTWFFYATSQGSCTEAPLSLLCVPYWAAASLEGDCTTLSDSAWIAIGVANAIFYGLLAASARGLFLGGRKNLNVQPTQKFEINDPVRYKSVGVDIKGVIAPNLPSPDDSRLVYTFHRDGPKKVPDLFKVDARRLTRI